MAQRERLRRGVAFQHHHQVEVRTSSTTSGLPRNHQQPQLHHDVDLPDDLLRDYDDSDCTKDPLTCTKVVIRHLPPTLSKETFVTQIDAKYAGTYSWLSYHCGKSSSKKQVHSRAYLDFKHPEDILTFNESFAGHIFVNEKGAQFKAVVEYAPSQSVSDRSQQTDTLDGTIHKDSAYVVFCEMLAKPVESIPSEGHLQVGGQGETTEPVVTPLMEFIRQKRLEESLEKPKREHRRHGQTNQNNSRNAGSFNARRGGRGRRRQNDFRRREAANNNNSMMHSEQTSQARGSEPLEEGSRSYPNRMLLQRERNHFEEGSSRNYYKIRQAQAKEPNKQQHKAEMSAPGCFEEGSSSQAAYTPRNRPPAYYDNYRDRHSRGKEHEPPAAAEEQTNKPMRWKAEMNAPVYGRNARRPDRQIWTCRGRRSNNVREADEPLAGRGHQTEPEVSRTHGANKDPKDGDRESRHGKKPATSSGKRVWV